VGWLYRVRRIARGASKNTTEHDMPGLLLDKTSSVPQMLPPPTGAPLLAYTTHQAAKISGICRSLLYREIAAGRLIARKRGRRTIILDDDLRTWLAALPRMPATTKPAGDAAAVEETTGRPEGGTP
jgi:hypothetical protein